ncbi:SMP-30/gluconolactonase/LRE family protein [Nocardia bovistercoris]|uniref:SMP-30/Gluconolactonase/LRE-like region domain-containing protein n=1 Tax=Nocardia bovistercoris TaxID=2785916 RepID=A0A931I8G0_9NOCA|nr:hypothetical protein [Nocardia bovistercoris]MBH0775828.1 hypothetical protein [Nocardia bovistercoris]
MGIRRPRHPSGRVGVPAVRVGMAARVGPVLTKRVGLTLTTRVTSVLAVLAACVCGALPAANAEPAARADAVAGCVPARVETALPADIPIVDWSENVGFDAAGDLWVSRLYRNEVRRYDRTGASTGAVPVEFPGAVRLGPDGLLYVVYGDAPTSALRPGGILRFDPAAAQPHPEVVVSGLTTMPNGAAFDTDGTLYIATNTGVLRTTRDGVIDRDWSARAAIPGANGIAIRDHTVYLTTNAAPLGRVLSFPTAAPDQRTILADIPSRIPGVPDFTDDLIIDDSGTLYVATLSGTLTRIDPTIHTTCTILTTEPLTSVAATPGHPSDLLVGTERGPVLRVILAS